MVARRTHADSASGLRISPMFEGVGVIVSPATSIRNRNFPARHTLLALLRRHGALMLRGFSIGVEDFYALSDSVAPGVRRGVAGSTGSLELHGELCYLPLPPDVLWFFCLQPPSIGGQTTLCDGIRLAADLSPPTRRFFEMYPLTFEFLITAEKYQHRRNHVRLLRWLATFATQILGRGPYWGCSVAFDPDGSLRIRYQSPAIRKTRWGEKTAFVNTLLHALNTAKSYRQPYRLLSSIPESILSEVRGVAAQRSLQVAWRESDVLLLDNSRMMHGRRAFAGNRELCAVNGRLSLASRLLARLVMPEELL